MAILKDLTVFGPARFFSENLTVNGNNIVLEPQLAGYWQQKPGEFIGSDHYIAQYSTASYDNIPYINAYTKGTSFWPIYIGKHTSGFQYASYGNYGFGVQYDYRSTSRQYLNLYVSGSTASSAGTTSTRKNALSVDNNGNISMPMAVSIGSDLVVGRNLEAIDAVFNGEIIMQGNIYTDGSYINCLGAGVQSNYINTGPIYQRVYGTQKTIWRINKFTGIDTGIQHYGHQGFGVQYCGTQSKASLVLYTDGVSDTSWGDQNTINHVFGVQQDGSIFINLNTALQTEILYLMGIQSTDHKILNCGTDGPFMLGNEVYSGSDISIKENIHGYDTEFVNKLFAKNDITYSFNWKDSHRSSNGFIAQYIEDIMPEVIETGNDETKSVNYNSALSKVVGAMFLKIKELENEIIELKNIINKNNENLK